MAAQLERLPGDESMPIEATKLPDFLRRFRRFIESTDWDVLTPARQSRLDMGCITVIASALLYFFPIMGQICLR